MAAIIYRNELRHHGVDGQKWGVRRYQNEDGSYKPGAEGRYDPEPGQSGTKKRSFKEKLNEKIKEKKRKSKEKHQQELDEWNASMKKLSEKKAEKKAEKERKTAEKNERKAANKLTRDEIRRKQEEYAEQRHLQRQADRDKKASKDSYKKVIARGIGRRLVGGIAGGIAGNAYYRATGDYDKASKIASGIGAASTIYSAHKAYKEASAIQDYRRRNKSARHSDASYDELYHGNLGGTYGIIRS